LGRVGRISIVGGRRRIRASPKAAARAFRLHRLTRVAIATGGVRPRLRDRARHRARTGANVRREKSALGGLAPPSPADLKPRSHRAYSAERKSVRSQDQPSRLTAKKLPRNVCTPYLANRSVRPKHIAPLSGLGRVTRARIEHDPCSTPNPAIPIRLYGEDCFSGECPICSQC